MSDPTEPNEEIQDNEETSRENQHDGELDEPTKSSELDDIVQDHPNQKEEQVEQETEPDLAVDMELEEPAAKENKFNSQDHQITTTKKRLIYLIILGLIFMLIGGFISSFLTFVWFDRHNTYRDELEKLKNFSTKTISELQTTVQQLERKIEDRELEFNNLSLGYAQVSKVLEGSNKPPAKPRYKNINNGLLVYWLDDVLWRRYYIYKAKGSRGKLKKQSRRPQKKNFLYIENLSRGTWRYAISAIDREGKETEKSEPVTIIIKK